MASNRPARGGEAIDSSDGIAPAPRAGPGSEARSLDPLIHERVRLAIVSAAASAEWVSFAELRDAVGATDGNLSVHARRLEDAGYLECRKRFEKRRPLTQYRLTPVGTGALERYLGHMEALIRATREASG